MQVTRVTCWLFLFFVLAACQSTPTPSPTASALTPAPSVTLAPTRQATAPPTAAATRTPLPSSTPSPVPSSTSSPSPSPIPTYTILRGEVIVDQAVCHYGPGAPYLYKYGVIAGSNLEIIRRVIGHNYIEVQAIGGSNPCWVRADYMRIKTGDLSSVQPVHPFDVKPPITPYYGAPGSVSAVREGTQVTVSWPALVLKAGDDSEQTPYIVEAWVCRDGQMVFDPVPARQTTVVVRDDPGCSEPSKAYLIYAEKHGYTPRLPIPWPPAVPERL